MLFGAAFGLLVVGVAFFLYAQRDHTQNRERAAAYSAEYPSQQIQAECVQVPRTRTFTCVANAPEAGGDERYTQADLKAQQEMAEWALAMFFATAGGVLITFAGVVYVAMTLHETRRMSAEAAKATSASEVAAKAAQDANAGFIDASKRELRAYVHVVKAEITDVAENNIPRFVVQFINAGQTPAHKVIVAIGSLITVENDPVFDRSKGESSSASVIGPGQIQTHSNRMLSTLNRQQMEAIRKRVQVLHVLGEVTYLDAFDRPWATKFSYRYDAEGIGDGRSMIVNDTGNEAS
jgi:hypothetical protein